MPDDGPHKKSTTDLIVLIIGECIGVPLCIAGGENFAHGEYSYSAVGWGFGIPFVLAGATFPFWRDALRTKIISLIEPHARAMIVASVLMAFLFAVGPTAYRRATMHEQSEVPRTNPAIEAMRIQLDQALQDLAKAKEARTAAPITPPSGSQPLSPILKLDDAKRFKLVKQFRDNLRSNQSGARITCHAMVHEQPNSPWASKFFADLNPVLGYAGWLLEGGRTQKTYIPPGVTLSVSKDAGDGFACAVRLSEVLASFQVQVSFKDNQVTPDLVACEKENPKDGCLEISVGNDR